MTIIRHYHVDGTLQRSIVNPARGFARRIARWVKKDGELDDVIPEGPIWQERIHTGEFQNVTPTRAAELERDFVSALILANQQ